MNEKDTTGPSGIAIKTVQDVTQVAQLLSEEIRLYRRRVNELLVGYVTLLALGTYFVPQMPVYTLEVFIAFVVSTILVFLLFARLVLLTSHRNGFRIRERERLLALLDSGNITFFHSGKLEGNNRAGSESTKTQGPLKIKADGGYTATLLGFAIVVAGFAIVLSWVQIPA